MHLLILSEAFPPETKSCSTLFFELAESLVKRGHEVSVITRMPRYNVADGVDCKKILKKEIISGVKVYRLSIPPLLRNVPIVRGFEHFLLAFIFFYGGGRNKKFLCGFFFFPPPSLWILSYFLFLL